MSDFSTTFGKLRTKLQSFTALPIYYPNDMRTPSLKNAPNGYVYSEIRIHDEKPIEIGGNASRRDYGEMEIWIMVPRGTLPGTAESYAEQVRGLFGVDTIDGVIVTRKTVDVGQIVPTNFGRMYAVPVRIDWWADRSQAGEAIIGTAILWGNVPIVWGGTTITWGS